MTSQKPVQRIAIVGTGTIGASWATHYLAHGFDVTATDPAPGAETALRSYVEGAWEGVKTRAGARRPPTAQFTPTAGSPRGRRLFRKTHRSAGTQSSCSLT
jgi:3-hydroxyacyl-CoA dehydrogenase